MSEPPRSLLKSAIRELEEGGLEVLETVDLAPFSRNHFCLILRPVLGADLPTEPRRPLRG